MIIQTERLILRAFKDGDIAWYHEFLQNDELKHNLKGIYQTDIEETKKDIALFVQGDFENDFYFVIENKETREVMGIIIAVRITGRHIDVSYFLKSEFRHKGYMHEALEIFMEVARRENPVYCFRMIINYENESSLNVVKKFEADIQKLDERYICYI